MVYEDDPSRGKDRPVLVVGRDRGTLLGLMLSSQEHHRDDRDWVGIGAGPWDYEGRESWVREKFEVVAMRLRRDYSWS